MKEIEELEKDGVKVLCCYNEPFQNKLQIFAFMPIELIKPAPFQREISSPHVKRLSQAIARTKRYLDPIIVVRDKKKGYWTPNGHHRLEAAVKLGIKSLPVILILEEEVGRHVLAMNVEKAHSVRDKSLEVIKLYKEILKESPDRKENEFAEVFESGGYITMGLIYSSKEKFSGSAYESLLMKIDTFFDERMEDAFPLRKRRAMLLSEVDDEVEEVVNYLKEQGRMHPFLKMEVVSKANPIKRKRLVSISFEEVMERLRENLSNVKLFEEEY